MKATEQYFPVVLFIIVYYSLPQSVLIMTLDDFNKGKEKDTSLNNANNWLKSLAIRGKLIKRKK